MRFIAPAIAVSAAVGPLKAQTPLAGVWNVTYPAGTRVDNGVQSPILGTGTLRIQIRGDSLIGEFAAKPSAEMPTPTPVRLSGVSGPMPASLVAHQTTVVEVNDAPKLIAFTSTWSLEVKGDSLMGSLSHQVDDPTVSAQEPGPVRGARQRP